MVRMHLTIVLFKVEISSILRFFFHSLRVPANCTLNDRFRRNVASFMVVKEFYLICDQYHQARIRSILRKYTNFVCVEIQSIIRFVGRFCCVSVNACIKDFCSNGGTIFYQDEIRGERYLSVWKFRMISRGMAGTSFVLSLRETALVWSSSPFFKIRIPFFVKRLRETGTK